LPDVSQLQEEVLIHQQFIGAVGDQTLRATQRKLGQYARPVIERGSGKAVQKDGSRLVIR
jgi:hypothetical protein